MGMGIKIFNRNLKISKKITITGTILQYEVTQINNVMMYSDGHNFKVNVTHTLSVLCSEWYIRAHTQSRWSLHRTTLYN